MTLEYTLILILINVIIGLVYFFKKKLKNQKKIFFKLKKTSNESISYHNKFLNQFSQNINLLENIIKDYRVLHKKMQKDINCFQLKNSKQKIKTDKNDIYNIPRDYCEDYTQLINAKKVNK